MQCKKGDEGVQNSAHNSYMDGPFFFLSSSSSSLLVPLHFHRNHHAVRLSVVGSAQFSSCCGSFRDILFCSPGETKWRLRPIDVVITRVAFLLRQATPTAEVPRRRASANICGRVFVMRGRFVALLESQVCILFIR